MTGVKAGPVGTSRHLVIMAAGTGGHVIPGLAVAREMQARGWTVSWLGTTTGMENRLVPPTGIPMDRLAFTGLRGKGWRHTLAGVPRLIGAFWAAARSLRQRRASAVLGMGGYVCVPGGWAAALLRRPLLLVNADAALLMSNRALLPLARRVAFGFDGPAAQALPKACVTGNPVRQEVQAVAPPEQRLAGRSGPLRLLVVGGSLGARVLNQTLPQALALMPAALRPTVLHQTGADAAEAVASDYAARGVAAEVRPFIDDMARQLADCDLIVCRAGAITVSELCAAGVASVLVPLVVSTTSHQRDNAAWLAGCGAALHLPQTEFTPQRLAECLQSLDRQRLMTLAQAARRLARPGAAAAVADEIEHLIAP